MRVKTYTLQLRTGADVSLHDITAQLRSRVADSGIHNGFVTVTSQHTTTALSINEYEPRLIEDVKAFLRRLIPSRDSYLHNASICATAHRMSRRMRIRISPRCCSAARR